MELNGRTECYVCVSTLQSIVLSKKQINPLTVKKFFFHQNFIIWKRTVKI